MVYVTKNNPVERPEKMRKSLGFNLVGIVFIVATIAIVGIIGWKVWSAATHQNQEGSNADPTTNNSSRTDTTAPQTDTTAYLDIKELGVKIKLDDEIKDAVYYYDSAARVSTKSLIEKSGGACDPKTSAPFGFLTGAQDAVGAKVFESGPIVITHNMSTSACSDDPEIQALSLKQLAHFKEALKTMKSDKS